MQQHIAGVILAGGQGKRMGGTRKALLQVGGVSLLERLLDVYRQIFGEIVIAAREIEPYAAFGERVVLDKMEARSSLTGIHAGLAAIRADHAFFTACDVPFLHPGLVRELLAHVRPDSDVVLPRKQDGYHEPLCAVYSRRCLPHIAAQLERKEYKIISFFPKVRVHDVPVARLQRHDPGLLSFRNLNTPEELELARQRAATIPTPGS
ncbi:molybdopterin-guanine dinucleotide biosynthesis protein A [Paucidesulfovibrio gracilis DSM 16080]|uniref:Probable molybdenum cofactor guanylyltransferase n=1 Tax=Paucidesulfovibrio gracilis DSM 16080 TaxID=1121449 RepID=A0A1T4W8U8_9BACT|nr:molybdenum cofactor guanylyltransferase [Paucidesulfovibrio gracilis]SKA73425.1 molybdopterin-guanine dinucleotide biosynthesis protein A [Paucidesulfovibrio gracilis DSM 16080]